MRIKDCISPSFGLFTIVLTHPNWLSSPWLRFCVFSWWLVCLFLNFTSFYCDHCLKHDRSSTHDDTFSVQVHLQVVNSFVISTRTVHASFLAAFLWSFRLGCVLFFGLFLFCSTAGNSSLLLKEEEEMPNSEWLRHSKSFLQSDNANPFVVIFKSVRVLICSKLLKRFSIFVELANSFVV